MCERYDVRVSRVEARAGAQCVAAPLHGAHTGRGPRLARCVIFRRGLDAGLGERHPQVVGLRQLVVVHLDQRRHRVVDRRQLDQRHFAVLREELERLNRESSLGEGFLDIVFRHRSSGN